MLALRIIWRLDCGSIDRSRISALSQQGIMCVNFIYYEGFNSIVEAIAREKLIKGKSRKWKEALIQQMNPEWSDLTGVAASL